MYEHFTVLVQSPALSYVECPRANRHKHDLYWRASPLKSAAVGQLGRVSCPHLLPPAHASHGSRHTLLLFTPGAGGARVHSWAYRTITVEQSRRVVGIKRRVGGASPCSCHVFVLLPAQRGQVAVLHMRAEARTNINCLLSAPLQRHASGTSAGTAAGRDACILSIEHLYESHSVGFGGLANQLLVGLTKHLCLFGCAFAC